ncbi:MAG: T9SS type A sorting domain-containing protein [Bacteroidota bacterium]
MKKILLFTTVSLLAYSSFAQLRISEIRIEQPGTDDDEYFELQNMTSSDIDLDDPACDYSYIVIGDGSSSAGSGVIEAVIDLTGTIPASGFYVVAEPTFSIGVENQTSNLSFENSDNVTHLLVKNFTGSNGDDLDSDNDCSLDAAFPGTIIDGVALIESMNGMSVPPSGTECEYGTDLSLPLVGPNGSSVPSQVGRNPLTGDWVIGELSISLGTDTPGGINTPLPVDLIYFSAEPRSSNRVLLEWTTASEEENDYFQIEKSRDGQKFEAIGKVKGAGNSLEQKTYRFVDEAAKAGVNYYRLAQFDYDGTMEYHQVVAVAMKDKDTKVEIYPTLVNEELNVNLEGEAIVSIMNISGALVKEVQVFNYTMLNVSDLMAGNYFLVIKGESFVEALRIVKQ